METCIGELILIFVGDAAPVTIDYLTRTGRRDRADKTSTEGEMTIYLMSLMQIRSIEPLMTRLKCEYLACLKLQW